MRKYLLCLFPGIFLLFPFNTAITQVPFHHDVNETGFAKEYINPAGLFFTGRYEMNSDDQADAAPYLHNNNGNTPGIPYSAKSVDPLLTSYWGQACYYNDSCPADTLGNCDHARTGCGATAMAQIMRYHGYPEHGHGFHQYTHYKYGLLTAGFGNAYYDWINMTDRLSYLSTPEERAAVSRLMYHCGIAVDMDYNYNVSNSGSTNIRNAFVDYFGYASTCQQINKVNYSDSAWKSVLRTEIDAGRPVFYAMSQGTGGHFAIIDGYNEDDYFHFNWGNGVMAGYWKLLSELPVIHEAIIGIEPASGICNSYTMLEATNSIIEDGSSYSDYTSNNDCQWLLAPRGADSIALVFGGFNTESGKDYLNIYDGESTSAPLLGSYSGENLPPVLFSSGNKVLLEFITDEANNGPGWRLNYSGINHLFEGSGFTILTDTSGTFDDGSGQANYVNSTDKYWLIKPPGASSVTLNFTFFNTELTGDIVRVYDGENADPGRLLGYFSGNAIPPALTAQSGVMLVHFNSEVSTTQAGWTASYTSAYEGFYADIRVFLEGPFSGNFMNPAIPGLLPESQPFDCHPWNYFGDENTEGPVLQDITDWILLEIRETAYGPDSALRHTVVDRVPCLLNTEGYLRSINNGYPYINRPVAANLYAVLYHRNHLPVMSSQPLNFVNGMYSYDFTQDPLRYFGGMSACRILAPGICGMIGGDGNADGNVNNYDKIGVWMDQAGQAGYLGGDFNLDSQVNNTDKLQIWKPASGSATQIP